MSNTSTDVALWLILANVAQTESIATAAGVMAVFLATCGVLGWWLDRRSRVGRVA